MQIKLLISLSGMFVVTCLFLMYFYTKTEETFARPKQDLEIYNDINKPLKEVSNKTQDSNIQELVQKLYSSNEKVRLVAKAKLIESVKESDVERKKVIDSILLSLEISSIQYGMVNPNLNYEGWVLAVMILGEIKASEALPTLIMCLDCNNGVGGNSLYRYPVAYSISLIGDESIPYLEESLQDSSKNNTFRLCALLALDSIGGEKSRIALENTLLIEKNEHFKILIKKSVKKQQNNENPKE